MIIDSHTHIFPPEVKTHRDRYLKADSAFAELYARPSSRLAGAEDLVESMDTNGIDMSIVCGFQWSSPELCCESNNYILDSINRYPGRLIGLGVVLPESGDKALYELERCSKAGIKGIGEMRPQPSSLDTAVDSLWTPIVNFLISQNMVCLFHSSEPIGHPYPGKGDLTPRILYPFIMRHPGLKILLAHWGGGLPFYALMPEVKKTLTNVWFDTAASPFLYDSAIYKHVIDVAGVKHVLFGSDYPLISQKRSLGEIEGLGLEAEQKNRLLGLNAADCLELSGNEQ